jgi:UDP-N-acetylmuramate: L-alanyl-gamma-D-glutamyl-meso-diaminopimelate ligase
VICSDFPAALDVAQAAQKPFTTFGLSAPADWQVRDVLDDGKQLHFTVTYQQREIARFATPMMGQMNIRNALGVTALCCSVGIPAADLAPGFATFLGVERRQELIGEARGITIIDDFAHHPTAVTVTIEAVKMRYPQRRLWAVFEPRSNTCRRRIFQQPLANALARADGVVIGPVFTKPQDPIATEELFSPAELTADLQQLGKKAHAGQGTEEIVSFLTEQCRAGDVVLVMSNGAFGGLPRKLLATLQA